MATPATGRGAAIANSSRFKPHSLSMMDGSALDNASFGRRVCGPAKACGGMDAAGRFESLFGSRHTPLG
jgi:hypothetical protein